MDFGIAKFRIAKFSHCEIRIGIANFKLALRNGFWHCEISHCEIFALRNWNWHCEMDFGIAKFSLALRNFRNAKFRKGQFSQSYSVLGILDFAMRNWFANSLRKSCFVDFPCFSSCLQLHLILFTFPSIFH